MKKSSTVFLQIVIVLLGIGAAALLLWMPHTEGVNANVTSLAQIYLDDPFLALVYVGSIPFFVALYQAFMILGYVGKNKVFSQKTVKGLRTIKYCALIIIGFLVAEEAFIMLTHGNDDAAGAIMMGLVMIFVSSIIATAAALVEKTLQSAVDLKSENDLTV